MLRRFGALALALMLAACASGPPDWIAQPAEEGLFAATACVPDSGNLSVDRQVTVAKARDEVAAQLVRRIARLDAAFERLAAASPAAAQEEGGAAPEPPTREVAFADVARRVVEAALVDLAPSRVEYVEVGDARQVCALMAVDDEQAPGLFDALAQAAGLRADEALKEALYAELTGAE